MILIARSGFYFQIVNDASSREEAIEMIHGYIHCAGDDDLCPEYFELHSRDENGSFLKIEKIMEIDY